MKSELLRFDDWTNPVTPADREVVSELPEEGSTEEKTSKPPVLFVPGLGQGAWVFATHWLAQTAARGFPAHALTPRPGGDLRAQVHDVVQTAAALPRQAVLIGHGVGGLVVAHALGRYPARAVVLAAPVLDSWATLGAAFRANPFGTLPGLVGGRIRMSRRQLFGPGLPVEEANAYVDRIAARPRRDLAAPGPAPKPVGDPPVLVVGSPDDRVVPRKSLDRTATRYGGAPLLFPGMGHSLMLDVNWSDPIEAILDWLDKELSAAS